MMNNNKILTVSYGTFSCTLEGFDDSFGTMKAIAEYFRDLAADDRYFGAEPPQPDAEMLARIAQKEVSRRVQAREQDGKIVLSALEDKADVPVRAREASQGTIPAAAIAAAPQAVAAPAAVLVEDEIDTSGDAAAEDSIAAFTVDTSPMEVTDIADAPDTVRIEMAEVEEATLIVEDAVADEAEEASEAVAEDAEEAPVAAIGTDHVEAEAQDMVPGQPDADVEAFFAETAGKTDAQEFEQEEETATAPVMHVLETPAAPAAKPALAPDSIAAKLERIRAVVAQHEEVDEDDEDYLEDQHADAAASAHDAETLAEEDEDESEAVIARARSELEDALEADDEVIAAEEASDDEDEDEDVSSFLKSLESTEAEAKTEAREEDDEDRAHEDSDAEVTLTSDEEFEDEGFDDEDEIEAQAEDTVSNLFDENEETLAQDEDAVEAETAQAEEDEDVAEAPGLRTTSNLRARVIKVKRADLEAAIAKGELEEYDEDDDAELSAKDEDEEETAAAKAPVLDDLAPARRSTTALSPEAEAELARELAALEKDISANGRREAMKDEDEEEVDDTPKPSLRKERPGGTARELLPSIDEGEGADVNRLLAETDHQMDEPESATRRDAFAHLRAAVAAKKADSTINDDDSEHGDNVYRSDLAQVVRPRRPVAGQTRTERPEDARPAPLKLVAEQRIDIAKPRTAGPVRPRRVSADLDTGSAGHDGESFAEFAADRGASTLPQLLEAAAAYMSFVEGREQFSRPQLMTKVRQAGGQEEFSREDGLRSFGQLLRTGKIEKIKGGRFTVSDDIGYRPDHRAAG